MSTHPLLQRIAVGVLPLVLIASSGFLLVREPGGGASTLPDPEAMAVLGDDRRSSRDIVRFWEERVIDAPEVAANHTSLAAAQLTLAGDTGDLSGYETAEQTAIKALTLTPDDPGTVLTLAAARAGQHRFDEALDHADDVLAEDPASESALLVAGDARLELGDYEGARHAYELVVAEVGEVPAILSRTARLEATVGRLDNARHLARRALVEAADQDLRHADAAFYWLQLASYEFALGDHAAAHDLLRPALEIDPGNPAALELLARVLAAEGDDEAAIAVYEDLVGDRGAADLHGELAKLLRRAGRDAEADDQVALGLDVAADTADRFPAERRHLIGFLADHDPEEALRLAALDLSERQDVMAHAWYAWSLFRTGDVAGARAAIEPALAYGTQDARLLYQAGAIHLAAGDRAEAADLLGQAIDLNPEFDVVHATEASRLLTQID